MSLETIDFAQGWSNLQIGITELIQYVEGVPGHSYTAEQSMRLFSTVYTMCTQKPPHDYSEQLYYKHREVIEEYINTTVVPALSEKYDDDGCMLLRVLVKRWSIYKKMVTKLSDIFAYLDRYFVARSRRELLSLREVGLTCFRDLVYVKLQRKVKEAVIALVDRERDGEDIDRAVMKDVRDFYVEMERYELDFEGFMLEETPSYFSRKASRWIQEDSFFDYILKAEECLKKEKERVIQYLYSSSGRKLVTQVEYELFLVYKNQLLEKKHSEFSEIARALETIANIFKQPVADADGDEDTATNQAAIRKVIELHDKYIVYVTECFQNQTIFLKALKEAFKSFCSKAVAGSSLSAEPLATLCERIIILKKWASEELSDEAIEKVVNFLAFITDDKDLFLEVYRKKLARRLLLNRGDCFAHERRIITKLKQQFGGHCTLKMEGMVTDLTLSIENQNSFHEYVANNLAAKPGIDMTVTLLTAGVWSSYKTFEVNLPSEMVKSVEAFQGFYEANTKRRKLTWIHSLGRCHIDGKFDQKPIELVVSTHQAAVLLLFNTRDKLDYTEIQTQLNVRHEDLVWLLHSLSGAKYKILIKEPATETVSKTDVFEFNSKFTARTSRVKIPLPYIDGRKKVVEHVDNERRYAVDASIVRIMKGRKVLGQEQLVSECVEQLSRMFNPDIEAINRRIEALIIRDYLEREMENPTMLRYLA